MSDNWYTEYSSAMNMLRRQANGLASLADAFEETGNERMAERLAHEASIMKMDIERADKAISNMIHEEYQQSMENIGKTFQALLGGDHNKEPA